MVNMACSLENSDSKFGLQCLPRTMTSARQASCRKFHHVSSFLIDLFGDLYDINWTLGDIVHWLLSQVSVKLRAAQRAESLFVLFQRSSSYILCIAERSIQNSCWWSLTSIPAALSWSSLPSPTNSGCSSYQKLQETFWIYEIGWNCFWSSMLDRKQFVTLVNLHIVVNRLDSFYVSRI